MLLRSLGLSVRTSRCARRRPRAGAARLACERLEARALLSADALRISEIHYHPADPTPAESAALPGVAADDFEFLELVNTGTSVADLREVALSQSPFNGDLQGVDFAFQAGDVSQLAPGERAIVVEDLAAFQLRYGSTSNVAGAWRGRLSNSQEQLTLTVNDRVVQQFSYRDTWHPATDGGGRSLEIVDESQTDLAVWGVAAGWRTSSLAGGTPGEAPTLPGDLNRDGALTADDIDHLHAAIRAGEVGGPLDLNGDGLLDRFDVDQLVYGVLQTSLGDANLDGKVTRVSDAASLITGLGSDREILGWDAGDFDGDGLVTASEDGAWLLSALDRQTKSPEYLGLFISEFMPSNRSTLRAADGSWPDWIELFNDRDQDIDLHGYYLTDDPRREHRWRIPQLTVPAGEAAIVYASGENGRLGPDLHTDFQLDRQGGHLALLAPDGATVISSFQYPAVGVDVALGLAMSDFQPVRPVDDPAETLIPIQGIQILQEGPLPRLLHNRVDEARAIDGNLRTRTFLTPTGTVGPHLAALDLGSLERIERLRVLKFGDIDAAPGSGAPGLGNFDNMDLQILFSTDTGPLNTRTFHPVSGLTNGFRGTELIIAGAVHPEDATVDNDHHHYTSGGWYSLSFDAVEATALAIRFDRDADDSRPFVNYRVWEMSVHAAPPLEPEGDGPFAVLGRVTSEAPRRLVRATPGGLNRSTRPGPTADGQADSVVTFNEISLSSHEQGWVELFNQYGVAVDLSGWRLEGGVYYEFPRDTILPGGAHLVVAANPASLHGSLGPLSGTLHPGPQTLILRNNSGRILDTVTYTVAADTTTNSDGLAKRHSSLASGQPASWLVIPATAATPGTVNWITAAPPPEVEAVMPSEIVINEIFYHGPTHPARDAVPAQYEISSLISTDSTWRYNATGSDQGPEWASVAHPADGAAWQLGAAAFFDGVQLGAANNRGDEQLALDGNLETWSFLTPSSTTGAQIAVFDLETLQAVSRLRVAKLAETDGTAAGSPGLAPIDSMDLRILVTADVGPLADRRFHAVTGLTSGFAGAELIRAAAVDAFTGRVENDHHDYQQDGYYSLTFEPEEVSAVAIVFSRDPADSAPWTHYPIREIELRNGAAAPLEIQDLQVFRAPETLELNLPLSTSLPLGPRTFYFEQEFSVDDLTAVDDLLLEHTIDDGAVIYLNGHEVHRFNMPLGTIDGTTPAVAEITAADFEGVMLGVEHLQTGTNRLSVEVHQFGPTSPDDDLLMGLSLVARRETTPAIEAMPFREDSQEWIEFFNRGSETVDLGNWSLADAVSFQFPAGTQLAPNDYLIVARDPVGLSAANPDIRVLGGWTGRLGNNDDRLQLRDALGRLRDQVHYFDGGKWPELADGGGASLELRDPRADNDRAGAWAASQIAPHTSWQTYRYRGRAAPDTALVRWNEFVFGMLDAGEVLIDDVSVVEDPDGLALQLLQNGDFEDDTLGGDPASWRVIGNHHGQIVSDPDDVNNRVLHLLATGSTRDNHNHAETTLANNVPILIGKDYEVSFRARSLGGSRLLNSRLYFNKVAATHLLPLPSQMGTPGRENSQHIPNLGPTFGDLAHHPLLPGPNDPVTVRVTVEDPDGVASADLWYQVNGGNWMSLTMLPTPEGTWLADVPGGQQGDIVQFYVEGRDTAGAVTNFPAAGRESRALYRVESARPERPNHDFDILMTADDVATLRADTNLMSNQRLGTTVIFNGQDVYYDIGLRLKGTAFGRPGNASASYSIRFDDDQPFRGVHHKVLIDRSGLGLAGRGGQDEIITKQITNRAGGIPGMYDDIVYVTGPEAALDGPALFSTGFEDVFLESYYEQGSDAQVHKLEVVLTLTETVDGDPESLKRTVPGFVRTDIQDLGDHKEDYRWNLLLSNRRDRDVFDPMVAMAQAWSLEAAELQLATQQTMDVDAWMRMFAMVNLVGASDTYGRGSPHNLKLVVDPQDQRVAPMPWDLDGNFSLASNSPLWSDQAEWNNLRKIIELPANTRRFYGHLHDLIATAFSPATTGFWTSHYASLANENYGQIDNFIRQRSGFVWDQLPELVPFAAMIDATTGGEGEVTIQGTGWIDVERIYVRGQLEPLDVTWIDQEHWQAVIRMVPNGREIDVEAFDKFDNRVGSARVQL